MTVEDIIEALRDLPPTADVFVIEYEDIEMLVVSASYKSGRVILEIDDPSDEDVDNAMKALDDE